MICLGVVTKPPEISTHERIGSYGMQTGRLYDA